MINILLVEDDRTISKIIQHHLKASGKYAVTCAFDAAQALAASKGAFDVILLDVMLPDVSGIELCGTLRQWHNCPIIFISCLDNSSTIIQALGMGGDDYITKPFDTQVLEARIDANLRRVHMDHYSSRKGVITCGDLSLNMQTHELSRGRQTYRLETMEYEILAFLMQHPGQVFTAAELYQSVWGKPCYGDARTVTVHIYNLRQKVEADPKNPSHLINIWGKGYSFVKQK